MPNSEDTSMAAATAVPLIVLCSHRSGSSAFAGLLAGAGLHLGPLLPPSPDNPKGFFENRDVVAINKSILWSRDRDWTCPPPALDHRTVDLDPLREVTDSLRDARRPWGFKDPRTLFTLPAWAAAVERTRLVGVHRNSRAIAASLVARNDCSHEQAMALALAYAERLMEAHRLLGFPIVSFDAPRQVFVERTMRIAELHGLDVERDDVDGHYETSLVHHEPGDDGEPIDAYLAAAAEHEIGELATYTAATVNTAWDALPRQRTARLVDAFGPRHEQRRIEMLQTATRTLPGVGRVATLRADVVGKMGPADSITDVVPLAALLEGSAERDIGRWSHLIGPSLLDGVAPDDLAAALSAVAAHLDASGILAVDGWLIDSVPLPDSRIMGSAGVPAWRTRPPYLHHRVEIDAAVLRAHLSLVDIDELPSGRVMVMISNDPALRNPAALPPGELRSALVAAENSIEMLSGSVERLSERLDATMENLRRTEQLRDDGANRIDALTRSLDLARSDRAALERRAETAAAAAAAAKTRVEQLDDTVAALRQRSTDLKARARRAETKARTAQRSYDRLATRRIVRLSLAMAHPFRPLFGLIRTLRRPRSVAVEPTTGSGSVPPLTDETLRPPRTRQEVVDQIRALRPARHPVEGPRVSIIILTRDGAEHLRRLMPALTRVRYRSFEVIVVDNASSDETSEVLGAEWPFPLRVLRNDHNASFSDGNNQGAAVANGSLLLFLNNDLEPVTDDWLGAMVSAITEHPGRVAAGALLVYPDERDAGTDLTVQHRGIAFTFRDGAPHAVNLQGPDPADPALVETVEVAAATAATLLVTRESFDAVGGFTEGYVYGAEDVDLCLKLRRHGSIVVAGEAVLFHHESATQRVAAGDIIRINRIGNWRRFVETWAPTITRSVKRDGIDGQGKWTAAAQRTVAITLTHDDVDAGWGDYYTAHELGDAFTAEGWDVVYAQRHGDGWYQLPDNVDLIVSLLDSYDVRRAPSGAVTIAWVRNWVERWMSQPWFEAFDLVVTGSQVAADEVRLRSAHQPDVLPLATNPDRFHPGPPSPTFRAEYAFTGNNWGVGRKLIPMLDVRAGERFLLFGKNWDQDPRMLRYWRDHLPYDLMPELYRSVDIVLDDTAGPTLPHGFVNGRVFDALASGALVVTDNVAGSLELFGGALPTYENGHDLRRILDRYLADEPARAELAERLRSIVVEHHTYRHRARQFAELAGAAIDRPRVAVKIGVPKAEDAHRWGDYHFATGLVQALGKQGFVGEIHLLPEWDDTTRQDVDIVIHLRGLTTYAPKSAHVNVLWIISHPDDVSPAECEKYDLVCVASESLASRLASVIDTPVEFLPQATDAVRFGTAEPDPDLATEMLFVGNSRGQRRDAVDWAVAQDLPLTIYGSGWDDIVDPRLVRATYFPNEDLGRMYASAKVVLNDHWPDMRRQGIVSNRIFDALASGAVVISDDVEGIDAMFGGMVPTFGSEGELTAIAARYLADDDSRAELVAKARALVLEHHTFDRRAEQLVELIRPLLDGRPRDCDGHRFIFEEALESDPAVGAG